jgi:hypothetical protein
MNSKVCKFFMFTAFSLVSAVVLAAGNAPSMGSAPTAGSNAPGGAHHPCEVIKQACESAGFVKGEYKEGKGLWRDCIDPIIQGKPVNSAIPLPTVDPTVVAACKAKHANWGEGKVGK